ncbi:MAG TPA: DsbA family protein [Miltoncostaeaceae bacterium]|mgnify:CR=1 FL=1|nr:DsbA family protein [Miltoncostaeaceae bacterium]
MPARIDATLFTDPGCPWAYSALPALRVLEWRYDASLRWRLVVIGLAETSEQYVARGYTTADRALGWTAFRDRFGMPFAPSPKERVSATARACRAIVAARILEPGSEWAVLRALQLANFTSPLLLDRDDQLGAVLEGVPGVDAAGVVARLDAADVTEAYERDRAEARRAAGSPTEFQGKTATTDGPVRYTAPSVVFSRDGRTLEAGGWQTIEAYDVVVANLAPDIDRRDAPGGVAPLLERFPEGLTTQEVAALLVRGNDAPDRGAAERLLIRAAGDGIATRAPLGDDALWRPAAA